jgi:homoserine O-acetyltransferase
MASERGAEGEELPAVALPRPGDPWAPHAHPRCYSPDLPASGAWRPGDPVGRRQFLDVTADRPLVLEGGGQLDDVTIAYETWGTLSADADNAILVCHALTGDAHATGEIGAGQPTPGWWADLIGPGKTIDTDNHFVVCANVLGGCQGSTGPASLDPSTGAPYGPEFPTVTIRDIVRTQARVADHLGVRRWLTVVGGSMGGMQVLEWAVMFPERVRSIAPLATTLAATPWQIGWSAVGRAAIALDPGWSGGNYYDAAPGLGPHVGLAIARAVAQITYRSDEVFTARFGRELVDASAIFGLWDRFQVESYLDYHGEKLVRRFDANSYLVLNRAMDLHDIGRSRGGLPRAVARIGVPVLSLSISSDTLYAPTQQRLLHDMIQAAGGQCEYVMVESPQGHDGFLLEADAVGKALTEFLTDVQKMTT